MGAGDPLPLAPGCQACAAPRAPWAILSAPSPRGSWGSEARTCHLTQPGQVLGTGRTETDPALSSAVPGGQPHPGPWQYLRRAGQVIIPSTSHCVWAESPHRSRPGQLTPPAFRPGPAPCTRPRGGRRGVSSLCAHKQERAGGFQTRCAPQGRQGVLLRSVCGGVSVPAPAPPPSQGLTSCFSAPSQRLNSGAGPQTWCDLYTT